jgi:UDP-glucose 4-epimerase
MERVANVKIPTQLVGRRAGDIGMCVAKPSRAQEELGWRTKKSLETCCHDVWRLLELDRVTKEEALAKEPIAK